MRILVTGGAGFIGSHVVDAYVQAGHDVWALDDLSRGKREHVNPHARFVPMDLRSPDLYDLLREGHFDCVNHHAAQIDVRVSIADPAGDATVNILGTLNLLEAMRATGTPRFVFASPGSAIYGEGRQFPATEEHATVPLSPYGVAKLTVEHYLECYRQVHGLRYVVLRYAKAYGPRQDPNGGAGVVAIFCRRILRGERLTIYGDGEQTRDYVYVDDIARANVLALRHLTEVIESVPPAGSEQSLAGRRQQAGGGQLGTAELPNGRTAERSSSPLPAARRPPPADYRLNNSITQKLNNVFNIGTGIETSVNALAAMLLEAADTDCNVEYAPARPGEQMRSLIDPSRAAQILGWTPLVPLAEGLMETLAWFRSKEPVGSRHG